MSAQAAAGIYVHVPFCASRCSYCSFYSETAGDTASYVDALLQQIDRECGGEQVASVFVGGGTPSWLPPAELERVLGALSPLLAPGGEFSLECNPEDVDAALLDRLERGGVNRLSLGVQSLDDGELLAVGRRHDAGTARRALALAAARPLRLSADLIIGLPGQSAESFHHSLSGVLEFAPGHLSIYCLELEPDAPLRRELAEHPALDPGDAFFAERYLETDALLDRAGFEHYEVSNWCRSGEACRHNLGIWEGGDFLGLGPAAHSRLGDRRWTSGRDLARWQSALLAGEPAPRQEDRPDPDALALERLLLALRTRSGLASDDPLLASKTSFIRDLERSSWASCEGGRLVLSPAGWLRLDGILARLAS